MVRTLVKLCDRVPLALQYAPKLHTNHPSAGETTRSQAKFLPQSLAAPRPARLGTHSHKSLLNLGFDNPQYCLYSFDVINFNVFTQ